MAQIVLVVSEADAGKRLDQFLAAELPETSRSRLQQWIREGRVLVDEVTARPARKLQGGETVEVDPAPAKPLRAFPEDLPLQILYEDADVIAVNKAAGMTVHAGAGEESQSGTLVNALLHRYRRLSKLGGELRPGIVHRLDRWTSGVLVVARHERAQLKLAEAFEQRRVSKTYLALVHGCVQDPARPDAAIRDRRVETEGVWWARIEKPIGRDPRTRYRMSVVAGGRAAVTDYRPLRSRRDPAYSLLEVRIHTGRTHQIRVHLSSIGRPVVGDRLYGAPPSPEGLPSPPERFFLHAWKLGFTHPSTGAEAAFEAPLPPEFEAALTALAL